MIYKTIFDLRGNASQISIVKSALDKIKFPWEKIKPPKGIFIIGWANLNGGVSLTGKLHAGDHPATDSDIEPIEGKVNGRKYTLGVFYPSSGNIYIDNLLVKYPEIAKTTVSAEIAHLVDYFLPLTEAMRVQISTLMHGGSTTDHGHSWWEKQDYNAEYYTLIGESFMQAFTLAYSDMPFDTKGWTHYITKEQAPALRKIIGLERSDYVPQPLPPKSSGPVYWSKNTKLYHNSHKGIKGIVFFDSEQEAKNAGLSPCPSCFKK